MLVEVLFHASAGNLVAQLRGHGLSEEVPFQRFVGHAIPLQPAIGRLCRMQPAPATKSVHRLLQLRIGHLEGALFRGLSHQAGVHQTGNDAPLVPEEVQAGHRLVHFQRPAIDAHDLVFTRGVAVAQDPGHGAVGAETQRHGALFRQVQQRVVMHRPGIGLFFPDQVHIQVLIPLAKSAEMSGRLLRSHALAPPLQQGAQGIVQSVIKGARHSCLS